MKESVDLIVGAGVCCKLLLLEDLPHKLALVFVNIVPSGARLFFHVRAVQVGWAPACEGVKGGRTSIKNTVLKGVCCGAGKLLQLFQAG